MGGFQQSSQVGREAEPRVKVRMAQHEYDPMAHFPTGFKASANQV